MIVPYRDLHLILGLLTLGLVPAAAQDKAPPRLDALLAQVSAPGGCVRVDDDPTRIFKRQDTLSTQFFPGVQLIRGWCVAEHGDSVGAWLATDLDSVLYVLGSPVGFEVLRRRHPVRALTEQTALEYIHWAMLLQGALPADAVLIQDTTHTPMAVAHSVGLSRTQIGVARVLQRQGSAAKGSLMVYYAAHNCCTLWSGTPILELADGELIPLVKRRNSTSE